MEVVVAASPMGALHDTGRNHPERPERLGAVLRGISESGLKLTEIEAPPIERSDLALVHDPAYVDAIERFCLLGGGALDMDTFASYDTWAAATTAAGGVMAVVEELEGRADATGFALCRPPGHHALRSTGDGFLPVQQRRCGGSLAPVTGSAGGDPGLGCPPRKWNPDDDG